MSVPTHAVRHRRHGLDLDHTSFHVLGKDGASRIWCSVNASILICALSDVHRHPG